jgi:two-component system OmpR family response regulator
MSELSHAGLVVTLCSDWPDVDIGFSRPSFDIALVSAANATEMSALCRLIRWLSDVPTLVLFDRTDENDKVANLSAGADDWLSRPCDTGELLARIHSVLRRSRNRVLSRGRDTLVFEGFSVDQVHRRVIDPDGRLIELTTAEFDLLRALCSHPGRILTRKELLHLTNLHFGKPLDRSIDVHVCNLRLKIEKDPGRPEFIKTIRLVGYVFSAVVEATSRP